MKHHFKNGPLTLAIDIGGTGLKASVLDATGRMIVDRVRMKTPAPCPPSVMVNALVSLVKSLPSFDRVSIGFPGFVRSGKIVTAPHFGTKQWSEFELAEVLSKKWKKPVRLINDADMQGFAVISGKGLELVVTLGTGVGTALFRDGELMPHLELAHHPVHGKKTYNQYIGDAVRKNGKKKWNKRVARTIEIMKSLIHYDRIYLGGGNAAHLTIKLDRDARVVSNVAGILGGIALWKCPKP